MYKWALPNKVSMILAWKHHIAQHFKNDPTLIYNNYADAGGTIFTNFDRMKEYLESNTSEEYYVAPIIVYEDQISYINEHEYKLLYNIPIIGNFAPIKD